MKEETISKIANVLDTWNPLGEKANSIDGLDGYRIDAYSGDREHRFW